MSAFTSLELFVTDAILHIVESFNRTRPPRLLVVVSGWQTTDERTRGLLKSQPNTGVVGVSLGTPIAEQGQFEERQSFKWYAQEMCIPGVAPPLAWRSIGSEEIGRLLEALVALGLPGGTPHLDGLLNASGDYSHLTTVTGTIDGTPFRVRLNDMCTGYRGRDAAAFARFMRVLFEVAGIDATNNRWRAIFNVDPGR
jgi:hypothetical protein